jgi:hypothetical protein
MVHAQADAFAQSYWLSLDIPRFVGGSSRGALISTEMRDRGSASLD